MKYYAPKTPKGPLPWTLQYVHFVVNDAQGTPVWSVTIFINQPTICAEQQEWLNRNYIAANPEVAEASAAQISLNDGFHEPVIGTPGTVSLNWQPDGYWKPMYTGLP